MRNTQNILQKLPWLLAAGILTAGALLANPQAALAQDPNPVPTPSDNEVNEIAEDMYCPVCENIPLDVCGTQACAQWREQIREKLGEGWTEEEIKDYFVQLYGDRVLDEPPRRGLNWLIYILPPLAFILGALFLYRGFLSWHKPLPEIVESDAADEAQAEQDEYVSRLESELEDRK